MPVCERLPLLLLRPYSTCAVVCAVWLQDPRPHPPGRQGHRVSRVTDWAGSCTKAQAIDELDWIEQQLNGRDAADSARQTAASRTEARPLAAAGC